MGSSRHVWNTMSSSRAEVIFKFAPSKYQKGNIHLKRYLFTFPNYIQEATVTALVHKKHFLGNKMFNEHMYQGFLRRCRLHLSIFQTRICNGETTGVEWFVFIPAICVTFKKWSLRVHVCMCTGARACGHTFISVWDFQCASARGSWRQCSVRKVYLLWKPFGSCLVGQDFLCNF